MGDGNGVLSVEDIAAHYDVSKHPDVLSGRTDAKTALRSFLDGFDAKAGNQVITVQEWMDHFAGVSASIDSDDQFVRPTAPHPATTLCAHGPFRRRASRRRPDERPRLLAKAEPLSVLA